MVAENNRLAETVLLSNHNISFNYALLTDCIVQETDIFRDLALSLERVLVSILIKCTCGNALYYRILCMDA